MAILTAGNDAIDMREPDWGLTPVGDASAFLDAFDPVRTDVIENTATSFTYNSYDSRNNLVILKGTGNIPLGSLNSLTVEVPLYSVRLIYSGSMIIDPWGNVSGSITGISAYLTSDNRLLGQMTGINVPWDSSDLDSLTNPVILGGSDTLTGSPQADYLLGFGGDDSLYGGTGNDTLDGGAGIDVMTGGSGADIYVVDNVDDVVIEEPAAPVAGVLRVSTDAAGVQGNGGSLSASFSADGRYVVFESEASNLVAGDSNNMPHVFVKDLQTGAVTRVSTDAAGVQGNDGYSGLPSFSADGRYVVFQSEASNLVAGDTNNTLDVFVKDLQTGAIERVSTDAAGAQGDGHSASASFSADGRYVVFESEASNLVAGDTNNMLDVFVKDLQTGAIERVSTDAAGVQGNNGYTCSPRFSADGRYVAFHSWASNLVAGDTNGTYDVFVKDLQTGAIQRVSTDAAGAPGNGYSTYANFSTDGRYVVFDSLASNLVAGDSNGRSDIFVKDLQTGAIERVSTDAAGVQGNDSSDSANFSADGRYVVFGSNASNLVAGDSNGNRDIFVKDLQTGVIERVSTDAAGVQGNGGSLSASFSADGRYVVFDSLANNLVPGDTNDTQDVFRVANPFFGGASDPDTIHFAAGVEGTYTLAANVEDGVITGTVAGLNLTGNALDNHLTGNASTNVLSGGKGADTLDGGAGLDTAVFSGISAGYTLTRTSSGMTAVSAADGTDALINIERLQFTDKTLAFDLDGNAGQAYRLYQAAFDRVPDQGGLGYWIDQMDSGTGLSQVATGFINSAEFKALYGNNPSNAEFVTLLYDNVLHRAPDAGGHDFWMNELSHGVSREQVLTGFSESTENKVALMAFDMDGNMGKDYRLYQAAFDRQPDVSGLDYWYHQMNSGVTLQQVASGFINSAEFKALYGNNPSNAEFVTLLYDNVLHRAPDTGGFNFWMNDLDQGTSREQVLIGFSESLENQLSLVGIVQTGIEFV